jgi:gamma-glutamyl phosphate reductase
MFELSLNNIEQKLSKLTIEELLELEEKIMKIIRKKIKEKKSEDWKKDFLDVSVWDHLENEFEVRVDKWKIETF